MPLKTTIYVYAKSPFPPLSHLGFTDKKLSKSIQVPGKTAFLITSLNADYSYSYLDLARKYLKQR